MALDGAVQVGSNEVSVYEGPSRWGMLLGSLWEGKIVRFKFRGNIRLVIGGSFTTNEPAEWFSARIISLRRADGGIFDGDSRTTDEWIVRGEVLAPPMQRTFGLTFRGNYFANIGTGRFQFRGREERHEGDVGPLSWRLITLNDRRHKGEA